MKKLLLALSLLLPLCENVYDTMRTNIGKNQLFTK